MKAKSDHSSGWEIATTLVVKKKPHLWLAKDTIQEKVDLTGVVKQTQFDGKYPMKAKSDHSSGREIATILVVESHTTGGKTALIMAGKNAV